MGFRRLLLVLTGVVAYTEFSVLHEMVIAAEMESTTGRWHPVGLPARNTTRDWTVPGDGLVMWPASSTPQQERHPSQSAPAHNAAVPTQSSPSVGTRLRYLLRTRQEGDLIPAAAEKFYHPHAGPIYGPPHHYPPLPGGPSRPPDDTVKIELAYDRLVVRCIAKEPYEHMVWTRFPCPHDYYSGEGISVAEGTTVVDNTDLFDVQTSGSGGITSSELLLKEPLAKASTGVYVCEAWPHPHHHHHHHKDHDDDDYPYPYPYPFLPSLTDIFIIGGSELLDECYEYKPPYHHHHHHPHHFPPTFKHSPPLPLPPLPTIAHHKKRHDRYKPTQQKQQSTTEPKKKMTAAAKNEPLRKPRNMNMSTINRSDDLHLNTVESSNLVDGQKEKSQGPPHFTLYGTNTTTLPTDLIFKQFD